MIKFIWIPKEVWYYVAFPIFGILIFYLIFNLFYSKKKGTYYYNYVVDYVYSTLGIVFCGLLFCLLLGYSIATLQILSTNNLMKVYSLLTFVLIILPIIPAAFLVYVISVFCKNLKRKEVLDKNLKAEINGENYSNSDVSKQDIEKNETPMYTFDKDKHEEKKLDNDYQNINNEELSNNDIKLENNLDNTNDYELDDNSTIEKEYEEKNDYNFLKENKTHEINDVSINETSENNLNNEKKVEFKFDKDINLNDSNVENSIDFSTNHFQEEDFVPIKKSENYEDDGDYHLDNELEINDTKKIDDLNNNNQNKKYYYNKNSNYHNRNNRHNKYYNRNHKYNNNNSNQHQNNNKN